MPFDIRGALFKIEHGALDALPSARLGRGAECAGALPVVERNHCRVAAEATVKPLGCSPRLLFEGGRTLAKSLHTQPIRPEG